MAEKPEKNRTEIEGIIKVMKENGINEFEYCSGGRKTSVKYKEHEKTACQKRQEKQQEEIPEQPMKIEKPELPEHYILKSLYVGYCYLQGMKNDSERKEPFVKIGDKVGLEDILCMIECMKLPNEIKLKDYRDFSAEKGIIEEILVENEQAVEYGMPLMKIKPVLEENV